MPCKSKGLSKVKFGVLALCAIAAVAFAISPTQARANEINLVGSTSGFFDGTPGLTSLNSSNLSFTNNTYFNTNTVGGTAALNLGSFFLSGSPYDYTGSTFTIDVNFTSPPGSGSANSTAQILGSVSLNSGGLWVWQFTSIPPVPFTNSYGQPDSFQLAVNTVSLVPNSTLALTAFVDYTGWNSGSGGSVPEPSTMILAGLGIAGVFLLKKRLLVA